MTRKNQLPLASEPEMASKAAATGEVVRNQPQALLLYEMLCEVYARNKTELAGNPRAMFYMLRGALAASAIRDGYDIVELNDLFIPDIRYMSHQLDLPPFEKLSVSKKRGKHA
jgi:hypothetical protein